MESSILGLAVLLGSAIVILSVWLTVLHRKVRLLTRYHGLVLGGLEKKDVAEAVGRYIDDVEKVRVEMRGLDRRIDETQLKLDGALQKVSLVRFDAFEDLGGRMSFSTALLNDMGDGVVLTSINGRNESRLYAKPVVERQSKFTLTAEELEAIQVACAARQGPSVGEGLEARNG